MSKLSAPHAHTESSHGKMLFDILLAALPLGVFAWVNYGLRPLILLAVSVVTALVAEAVCGLIRRRPLRIVMDGTAAVTGLIVGLVMSPMTDYWVPAVGAAVAIVVAKAPFGGTGRHVFNPAAVGLAVLTFCFPEQMFTYPALTNGALPLDMSIGDVVVTAPSLAEQLRNGAVPTQSLLELLLGDFAGPIGGTAAVVLLAFLAYLLVRRTVSAWVVLPYLLTCILLAWLFPMGAMNPTYNIFTQMCSGYVLFTGVFLLNDPVTAPRFWAARIWYGIYAAGLVMLFQHLGAAQASSCFAILLINALSPIIDRWTWHSIRWISRKLRIRKEVKAYE